MIIIVWRADAHTVCHAACLISLYELREKSICLAAHVNEVGSLLDFSTRHEGQVAEAWLETERVRWRMVIDRIGTLVAW